MAMYQEPIYLDRETLYKMVWTTPVTELAAQYGISGRGFAKMCARLEIPVPGRGYWARTQNGQKIPPTPLPSAKRSIEKGVSIQVRERLPEEFIRNQRILGDLAQERLTENKIMVLQRLTSPHPLVAMTLEALNNVKLDEFNRLQLPKEECFNVHVGRNSVNRALRIMDALTKALEKRGYEVFIKNGSVTTCVSLLDEIVEFSINERCTRTTKELTAAEKKDSEKHPWKYNYNRFNFTPSGKLTLSIDTWCSSVSRRTWSDGKESKLEDHLNAFVASIVMTAKTKRAWRMKEEQEKLERQERIRQQEEQERMRKEEENRFQALDREVSAWQKSKQIRSYLHAVRMDALQRFGIIMPGSQLDQWLSWAEKQADRIDPLHVNAPVRLDRQPII
jgi:hypothetical protein